MLLYKNVEISPVLGDNTYGELDNGTTTDSATPVQVCGLTGCVRIAAGVEFSLAIEK
jgi:hypothetical protein